MTRFCLLLLAFIIMPTQVFAQAPEGPSPEEREQARQLYERGAMAYQQERWSDCAAHFEASFVIVFSPALLYNIGLCYERAASGDTERTDLDRAYRAFSRYVRESPDGDDAAEAQAHLVSVLERLRALPAASLEDEPDAAPTPPVHEEEPTPVVHVAVTPPPPAPLPIVPDTALPEAPTSHFRYRWTLVGAGLTALSAAVSLGYGVSANAKSAEYNNNPSSALRRSGLHRRRLANAFLAVSAVALAGTGIAFTLEFRGSRGEDRASLLWTRRF